MQDGILNEETYAQVGKELLDVQIDLMSFQHPILKKLLYGVGLADICGDWESIAPIIAKSDFVGWNAAGIEKNCYSYCVAQLKKSGNSLRSAGWGTTIAINPNIYQLFLTEDIAGMKKGYQAQQFTEGVLYLKKAIKSKTPVMVGVDAHADVDSKGKVKHVNKDKVTDHFVVIVGMNSDVSGKYFLFYDNATGDQEVGTSDQNKIYCSCINFSLIGTGANSYAQGGYGQYTITQIRESK